MSATLPIPALFLEHRVRIDVAGCGGNGSQMLHGLARIHRALIGRRHPGLCVRAWDPDTVSEANIGRQLFYPSDLGANKAITLVHRLNLAHGFSWQARPEAYSGPDERVLHAAYGGRWRTMEARDILITCVDSAKARRAIGRAITEHTHGNMATPRYWLDLGNSQRSGQVVLGQPVDRMNGPRHAGRLPTVVEFPWFPDESQPEDNRPSCSMAEALESQDLFINDWIAREALEMLWTWFRYGQLRYHVAWVNRETGEHAREPIPAAPIAVKEAA